MKIIVIDNNYAPACASVPLTWSLMTDSCLLREGKPFFLPSWSEKFQLFPSLAIRIDRLGKSIASRFAYRYWDMHTFGFNVRGIDELQALQGAKLSAGRATSFDYSVIIGSWQATDKALLPEMQFAIFRNDREVARWKYSNLLLDADNTVEAVSRRMTLKTGDIIYLGLTSSGIDINVDDSITVKSEIIGPSATISTDFLSFKVK